MEGTQKESKAPKSSSPSSPPWLDLQDPITELILERLPLREYLRSAAVCRKWRSIQKSHRLRYSPSPPPMAPSLPLLIFPDLNNQALAPLCYSPFDRTLHPLRLRLPSSLPLVDFVASSHGWLLLLLLLLEQEKPPLPTSRITPALLNPITGDHILLPPLDTALEFSCIGAISAPPSDPRCAVFIKIDDDYFLHRRSSDHNKWTRLDFPEPLANSIFNPVLHCAAKFYYVSDGFNFHVLDPLLPTPSMELLEMDTSQLFPKLNGELVSNFIFQELNGEILGLVGEYSTNSSLEGFHLFRADLSRNTWVGMEEGIGDRALFVAKRSPLSLLSADVGCNKNCIYFTREFIYDPEGHAREPWTTFEIFNLETKSFTSEQPVPDSTTRQVLLQFNEYYPEWFLPRLDYVIPAEASSAGSMEGS